MFHMHMVICMGCFHYVCWLWWLYIVMWQHWIVPGPIDLIKASPPTIITLSQRGGNRLKRLMQPWRRIIWTLRPPRATKLLENVNSQGRNGKYELLDVATEMKDAVVKRFWVGCCIRPYFVALMITVMWTYWKYFSGWGQPNTGKCLD